MYIKLVFVLINRLHNHSFVNTELGRFPEPPLVLENCTYKMLYCSYRYELPYMNIGQLCYVTVNHIVMSMLQYIIHLIVT